MLSRLGRPDVPMLTDEDMTLLAAHQRCRCERRAFEPDFVDAGDQHAQVVRDHLEQNLVELSGIGLATQAISELRLDHVEGRFHVRPLSWRSRSPCVSECRDLDVPFSHPLPGWQPAP